MRSIYLALATFAIVVPLTAWAQSPADADLGRLRREYAVHFLSPEAHLRLARAHRDAGRLQIAFDICETARRRFDERDFHAAFARVFLADADGTAPRRSEDDLRRALASQPNDVAALSALARVHAEREEWAKAEKLLARAIDLAPADFHVARDRADVLAQLGRPEEAARVFAVFAERNPQSEQVAVAKAADLLAARDRASIDAAAVVLVDALERHPESADVHFNLACARQEQGDLDTAQRLFLRAAELAPSVARVQGWVGRFFLRVRGQPERALPYYMTAYFLDPDHHDTEYAEQRLSEAAAAERDGLRDAIRAKPEDFLRHDNPLVRAQALENLSADWRPESRAALVDAMGVEPSGVGAIAARLLASHLDASSRELVVTLLGDENPLRQGQAAYVAVSLLGADGLDLLQPLFASEFELVRHDAVSAAILHGGAKGKALALRKLAREKQPEFRRLREAVAASGP